MHHQHHHSPSVRHSQRRYRNSIKFSSSHPRYSLASPPLWFNHRYPSSRWAYLNSNLQSSSIKVCLNLLFNPNPKSSRTIPGQWCNSKLVIFSRLNSYLSWTLTNQPLLRWSRSSKGLHCLRGTLLVERSANLFCYNKQLQNFLSFHNSTLKISCYLRGTWKNCHILWLHSKSKRLRSTWCTNPSFSTSSTSRPSRWTSHWRSRALS